MNRGGEKIVPHHEAIGAVIDEMYAMICGPAGPRDWSRQANCFLPEAKQVRTWVNEQGHAQKLSMGLEEYQRNPPLFSGEKDFYEEKKNRHIDQFGNIAHVWSAYEARRSLDDAQPERRGINSIQLFN